MGVVLKDFQIPVFTQNALLSIQIFNMISWKNLNKGWCLINSFPWWEFALKKIIDLHVTLTFIQIRVDKGPCLWNTELENRLVLHWFFFHGGIKKSLFDLHVNLTLTFIQIRPDIGTNTRIHIRPEKGTNENTEIHVRPDKGTN